jgi:glyceraldehyde-3-phosphate dehydrogenase/erythrose-4-phosphate dehydrogenase
MAKIPKALFKDRTRTLADLQPGHRAWFPLALISVDHDGNAFISVSTELAPLFEKRLEYVVAWLDNEWQISCRFEGLY